VKKECGLRLAGSEPQVYSNWNKTKIRRLPSPFNASFVYLACSWMYRAANLNADFGFSGNKSVALGTSSTPT
jgi:hypothetical protein